MFLKLTHKWINIVNHLAFSTLSSIICLNIQWFCRALPARQQNSTLLLQDIQSSSSLVEDAITFHFIFIVIPHSAKVYLLSSPFFIIFNYYYTIISVIYCYCCLELLLVDQHQQYPCRHWWYIHCAAFFIWFPVCRNLFNVFPSTITDNDSILLIQHPAINRIKKESLVPVKRITHFHIFFPPFRGM